MPAAPQTQHIRHKTPTHNTHNHAHLDVVAVLVLERRDLAAHPLAALIDVHLIALVQQLHGGGQTGQAAAHDGDLELGGALGGGRGRSVRFGEGASGERKRTAMAGGAARRRTGARAAWRYAGAQLGAGRSVAVQASNWGRRRRQRRTGAGGPGSAGNSDGSGASLGPTSWPETLSFMGRSGAATATTAVARRITAIAIEAGAASGRPGVGQADPRHSASHRSRSRLAALQIGSGTIHTHRCHSPGAVLRPGRAPRSGRATGAAPLAALKP